MLAVSNCVRLGGTSYAVLKHVEVEFWCGTCRCDTGTQCWVYRVNVKAAHFGARVLKRKSPGEGAMPNRREIRLFQGVNMDEIGWNFHGRIWTPRSTISTGIHSPGPLALWVSMQNTLCPGWEVARFGEATKREQQGDNLTGKQNVLMTIGTSRYMFVSAIFTPFAGAECRSLLHFLVPWAISLSPSHGLCCNPNCYMFTGLKRSERMGPDHWSQKEWENAVIHSLSVQFAGLRECSHPLPSCPDCHGREPSNLATWTQGICMLTHSARGPGEWIPVEMVDLGVQILPWKFQPISSMFTPWKSLISLLFGMAPSPGDFLLSTLAPKWAALTLTLYTQHCVPVSHLHVPHQNSTSTCFSTA